MKNILIASTYYENKNNKVLIPNDVWLKLQTNFIKSTTANYDFAVYLNSIRNKKLFKDCIVVGTNDKQDGIISGPNLSHRTALRAFIQYFRHHQKDYEAFCILDSDCFPVRKGWAKDIKKILKNRNLKFAAIARFENGENFPHPAGIIIPSEHIHEDIFHFPEKTGDFAVNNILDGDPIDDTGTMMTFWSNNGLQGHPLIRSNVINLHPLYAGIYGDMLYHHGLGSRIKINNGNPTEPDKSYRGKLYWNVHGKNFCKDFGLLFDMITKFPIKFIDNLRGNNLIKSNKFLNYFKSKNDIF